MENSDQEIELFLELHCVLGRIDDFRDLMVKNLADLDGEAQEAGNAGSETYDGNWIH